MDVSCLDYRLTGEERLAFDRDGYLIIEDALKADHVARLLAAVDRVEAEYRPKQGIDRLGRLSVRDFIGLDWEFVELVDWPRIIAKVIDILSWNLQIYHSHLNVTPPEPPGTAGGKNLSWHQDSALLNKELETNPRPRISLKVAYFLTDCTEDGRGNFYIIPGSHLTNDYNFPDGNRTFEVEGAMSVQVKPGTAVFFDRRLWHSVSANYWSEARRAIFYGYSYRWLRPRDDVSMSHVWDRLDPIRKQLFGNAPTGCYGFTSPQDEDVPLRGWLQEHLGEEVMA